MNKKKSLSRCLFSLYVFIYLFKVAEMCLNTLCNTKHQTETEQKQQQLEKLFYEKKEKKMGIKSTLMMVKKKVKQ